MLDLRRLEILHRFAVFGSISATAADLGYSASAISQQLATLEREAGVALIERTAHSAILTDAGRELAELAGGILDASEDAQGRMRARAGIISGKVEVACIPGLAVQLAPHLASLQQQHPGLRIVAREIGSTDASAAVLDGRTELAVIDDWTEHPKRPTSGLTVHELRREAILLAVRADHRVARTVKPLTAAAVRRIAENDTWLCAPTGQLSRSAGDAWLSAAQVVPSRRWEFEGLHVLAALVATGAGVALLPGTIVAEQPGIVAVALRPGMRRRVLAVTRTSSQHDPALVSCLQAVQRALAGRVD